MAQDTAHAQQNTWSVHIGEQELSGPEDRTRNTTRRACRPVNRSQVVQDTSQGTHQARTPVNQRQGAEDTAHMLAPRTTEGQVTTKHTPRVGPAAGAVPLGRWYEPGQAAIWQTSPGILSPMCPLGVLCCVCGVLATWLLFTGVYTRRVVLRVRCPWPLGPCSPMCWAGVLCCTCGVLGHWADVHRFCTLGVFCCVCGFQGDLAPFCRCARLVCCVACAGRLCWARTRPSRRPLFGSRLGLGTLRARTRPSEPPLFCSQLGRSSLPGTHTSVRTEAARLLVSRVCSGAPAHSCCRSGFFRAPSGLPGPSVCVSVCVCVRRPPCVRPSIVSGPGCPGPGWLVVAPPALSLFFSAPLVSAFLLFPAPGAVGQGAFRLPPPPFLFLFLSRVVRCLALPCCCVRCYVLCRLVVRCCVLWSIPWCYLVHCVVPWSCPPRHAALCWLCRTVLLCPPPLLLLFLSGLLLLLGPVSCFVLRAVPCCCAVPPVLHCALVCVVSCCVVFGSLVCAAWCCALLHVLFGSPTQSCSSPCCCSWCPRSFPPGLLVLCCSSLQRDSGQTTRGERKREAGGTWRLRECQRQ